MAISASYLVNSSFAELLYFQRKRLSVLLKKKTYLEGVSVSILWHLLYNAGVISELTHLTRTPGVKISSLVLIAAVIFKVEIEVIVAVVGKCRQLLDLHLL